MCLTFCHCCHCFSFTICCFFNVEHSKGHICTKVGKIWGIMVHFIYFHASVGPNESAQILYKKTIKINPVFFLQEGNLKKVKQGDVVASLHKLEVGNQ